MCQIPMVQLNEFWNRKWSEIQFSLKKWINVFYSISDDQIISIKSKYSPHLRSRKYKIISIKSKYSPHIRSTKIQNHFHKILFIEGFPIIVKACSNFWSYWIFNDKNPQHSTTFASEGESHKFGANWQYTTCCRNLYSIAKPQKPHNLHKHMIIVHKFIKVRTCGGSMLWGESICFGSETNPSICHNKLSNL
jgi:hypothetical protein